MCIHIYIYIYIYVCIFKYFNTVSLLYNKIVYQYTIVYINAKLTINSKLKDCP